jgi:hypothetical protein
VQLRPDAVDRPHPSRLAPTHRRYEEILAAHRRAVAAGDELYLDPATGYWVMTAPALAERGECCDNGCRHCPWVGA